MWDNYDNFNFVLDDDDYDNDITNINHPIFTDKFAMFKHAKDLCGNDVEKHKELYNMFSEVTYSKNDALKNIECPLGSQV